MSEALSFIEPVGDCLYVLMDERTGVSNIIATPENYRQISETGTVIAVGSKVGWDEETRTYAEDRLKPGDRVIISAYSGIHLQLKESYSTSTLHRILREHEIVCRRKE